VCNFRGGAQLTEGSQGVLPNYTKLGEDIGRSSIFVSEFGYLAAFSNAGRSKLIDVENDAKFRTF